MSDAPNECTECGTPLTMMGRHFEGPFKGSKHTTVDCIYVLQRKLDEAVADCDRTNAKLRRELEAAEAVVSAANCLWEGWAEGGCVVSPACGNCLWCRFELALKAWDRVIIHRAQSVPTSCSKTSGNAPKCATPDSKVGGK